MRYDRVCTARTKQYAANSQARDNATEHAQTHRLRETA
jgi:hypothetical protein